MANMERFDLMVERRPWPGKLGLQYFDYKARLLINERVYTGRGTDTDANLALVKAFAEALERRVMAEARLESSNGLAIHELEMKANNNARNELLERDAFFRFFYKKGARASLLNTEHLFFNRPTLAGSKIHQILCEVATYSVDQETIHCVLHVGLVKKNGRSAIAVGLGASLCSERAAQTAQIETWRNLVALAESIPDDGLSVEEFNINRRFGPKDHLRLGSDTSYANSIFTYLEKKISNQHQHSKPRKIEYVDHSIHLPESCPLFAKQALSTDCVNLHFGFCPPGVRSHFPEFDFFELPHPLA